MVAHLEVRWPVEHPEDPRDELLAEAMGDLAHLPDMGYPPLSAPVFSWHRAGSLHHHGLVLVARLAVQEPPREDHP